MLFDLSFWVHCFVLCNTSAVHTVRLQACTWISVHKFPSYLQIDKCKHQSEVFCKGVWILLKSSGVFSIPSLYSVWRRLLCALLCYASLWEAALHPPAVQPTFWPLVEVGHTVMCVRRVCSCLRQQCTRLTLMLWILLFLAQASPPASLLYKQLDPSVSIGSVLLSAWTAYDCAQRHCTGFLNLPKCGEAVPRAHWGVALCILMRPGCIWIISD